jgi:hypothetical protein
MPSMSHAAAGPPHLEKKPFLPRCVTTYLRSSRSFRIDRSYVFSPALEKKQPGTSSLSL